MAGFTLLEVMVAVAVLSTALVGLAYLQVLGLRSGNSAYYRSQATVLAYDMGERVRASPASAASYAVAMTATPPAADGSKATAAKIEWLSDLAKTLPQGKGGVGYSIAAGVETITITVQWSDNSQAQVAKTQTYAYSARL